jgi:hypothetical protein
VAVFRDLPLFALDVVLEFRLEDMVRAYTPLDKMIRGVDMVVDLSTKIKNPGPYDFAGIVGKRILERHTLATANA